MKKTIVLSGINLVEGGTLSIMQDILFHLSVNYGEKYKIIAYIHDKKLYSNILNVEFIEIKDSKKSYLKRIYYEYFYFKKLSKNLNTYLWLSMHDMTPNVNAQIRAVYCHNPMPFYNMNLRETLLDPKLKLFNIFYKYLYKINILKNNYIIVQQRWIADEFLKKYKINNKNLIVAHPEIKIEELVTNRKNEKNEKIIFFYPAFPRVFKNFEVICEAAKILRGKGWENIRFYMTIDESMNKYSKEILKKYKQEKLLKFIGKITREETFEYYRKADALIFPSKLETWGLPITEFKEFKKPIFLSDLPYAHETLGSYEKACFFNPNSAEELAMKLEKFLKSGQLKNIIYEGQDILTGWSELLNKLLNKEKNIEEKINNDN